MNINLVKATLDNAEEIHQMQIITFEPLLKKYQDFDWKAGVHTQEPAFAGESIINFLSNEDTSPFRARFFI